MQKVSYWLKYQFNFDQLKIEIEKNQMYKLRFIRMTEFMFTLNLGLVAILSAYFSFSFLLRQFVIATCRQ